MLRPVPAAKSGDASRTAETPLDRTTETQRSGLEIPGLTQRQSLLTALAAQASPHEDTASSPRQARSWRARANQDAPSAATGGDQTASSGIQSLMPETSPDDPPRTLDESGDQSVETPRAGLAIPGASRRRTPHTALAAQGSTQETAASAPRSLSPAASADRDFQRATPGGDKLDLTGPRPRVRDTIVDNRPSAQRRPTRTTRGAAVPTAERADDLPQRARQSTQPHGHADVFLHGSTRGLRSFVSEQNPGLIGTRPRATEAVEHLHQALTQRAARQVKSGDERHEAPLASRATRPLPAPAPPVVVVQRASAAIRLTPRAFWASSTLRSMHLRILR